MSEEKSYGKATVGYGTGDQREVDIKDFVQATFKNNRVISVMSLEDGTYVISVENTPSSGRICQQMRLSRESFIGLIATSLMYLNCKRENTNDVLRESIGKEEIEYSFSDNLKPFEGNDSSGS